MGKQKIKRFSSVRPNPTGLVSESGDSEDVQNQDAMLQAPGGGILRNAESIESFVSSIIEKLQSAKAEDRVCGCQMLTSVVSEPTARDILVKQNVARIIYPLFLDTSTEVQVNALGALRNICIYGSSSACNSFINSDVATPLIALIKQMGNDSAKKGSTKNNVMIQAIKLLAYLCESNPKTVSIFNKENILQQMVLLLNVEMFGYELSCASAQCLHVVSENNPDITTDSCPIPGFLQSLLDLAFGDAVDMEGILFRTLLIGIALNFNEPDVSPHYTTIMTKLNEVLDIDHMDVLRTAIEKGSQEEGEKKDLCPEDENPSDVDSLLQAQGICLELIANLCCSEDEWEDMDMDCEDMEESSSESIGDAEGNAAGAQVNETLSLSADVCSAFMKNDIITKIIRKSTVIDGPHTEQLKLVNWGENIHAKLKELQARALLCLSNVVSAIDAESLAKLTSLTNIWSNVFSLLENTQGETDEDYKWAVTSALRAVVQRIAEVGLSDIGEVTNKNLELLINIGAQSKNHETQINVIRIMSTIGCILSLQTSLHPLLSKIGMILIEVACNNSDVVVISEALDSIFDVFKEDNTDPVVREIGLVNKLKSLQPTFRSKIASEKKKLGENYGIVMMARDNLKGYIRYKTSG